MALLNRKIKIGYMDSLHIYDQVVEMDLLNYTATAMGFSYDVTTVTGVAEQLPNVTWTGLIGLLNRSEVDFVPAAFIVTEERWDAVAFNYPFAVGEVTFATRKPRYSPEIMALFRVLSLSVWLSLLMSIILVTLVCLVALKYRCAWKDVVFHVLAVCLNQQCTIIPQRSGEILLLGTWTVAMMLFTSCFKSVLLSFLSFPPLDGVRSVPELAAAIRVGQYSAMTVEGNYLTRYLQGSRNEDTRLVGESMLKTHGYVDKLLNNSLENLNVGFITERASLTFVEEKLFVSKDNMGILLSATAVTKDCCKDEMDMIVHRYLAAGIDQKMNRIEDFKYFSQFFWELPDDDKARKITMTDISGAFIVLVAGYSLSVCMLLIELSLNNRR